MKKISVLLLVLFSWIGVKAQNPVVITQPYKFQKWVHVKGGLFSDSVLLNTDSSNRVVTTAWAKRNKGAGVSSISGVNSNGFSWSIYNPTTIPALTLSLQNATTSQSGQLTNTDWNTFNNKQSSLAFSNGITNSFGSVTIGGSLTGNTTINPNGHFFQINDPSNTTNVNFSINAGTGVEAINLSYNDATNVAGGGFNANYQSGSQIFFRNPSTTAVQIIQLGGTTGSAPGKMSVVDGINSKGLEYIIDYSANYTSRSIPDVAYVLAHGGSGSAITGLMGDVTASGPGSATATIASSVNLSGSPTTTTQTTTDNSTKIATTAFVQANFTATAINFAPGTFTGSGTSGSPFALGIDASPTSGSSLPVTSGGVFTSLALKAPLASPGLTGTPTAPTATVGTNTTQIATTAFVLANSGGGLSASNFVFNEVPSGTINSSNVTFTLANTPTTGKISVFRNGVLTTAYTLSTNTLTMTVAPLTGDTLITNYMK